MIREFFLWYGQQMLGLLPSTLRSGQGKPSDALVVDAELPGILAFLHRRRGRETVLGRWAVSDDPEPARALLRPAARRRVTLLRLPGSLLRLPGSRLLERHVTLPLAAERALDRVLRFEMDRLTPFSADEVFWSATPVGHDTAAGTVRVRISFLPRASIEGLVAALGLVGLVPTLLEVISPDRESRIVPLSDHERDGSAGGGRHVAVLGYGCAVLSLIAVALPFATQSLRLAAVEARIEELKPAVMLADALRRRLAADPSGLDVVTAERARTGDALATLAAVTDVLPDDTFLTGLSLRQRHLAIEGQSQDAARLIGLLSADPTIHNAAFASPVTRSASGTDTFSIRGELGP